MNSEHAPASKWLPGFIALGITWGSSFMFIKYGLGTLNAVGISFIRNAIGAITLLIIAAITRTRLPRDGNTWFHLAMVGCLLNSLPHALFGYAEQHITSVVAGVLNATTPPLTALVVYFAFREKPLTRDQGIGLAIGFIGVCMVTLSAAGEGSNSLLGSLAIILATSCYAISYPYIRKFITPLNLPVISIATAQVVAASALLIPIVVFTGVTYAPWTKQSIFSMLILGSFGTGLAYIWNFNNIRYAGSTVASTVTYLTPVVSAVWGVLLLHEPLHALQVVGAVFVLISAALVQQRITLSRQSR